jgi:hypothetical protein
MPSSLSVAAATVVNSTIIGSPDEHDCPFQVAHPVELETEQATTAAEKNPAFFAETQWYAGCVTIR